MAKSCPVCGFELQDTDKFCNSCGTPVEEAAPAVQTEPAAQAAPTVAYNAVPQQPVYAYVPTVSNEPQIPPAGLSVGAFFGLNILFSLPFAGFILTVIMSFAPKNKTLKNFARSRLIWYAIAAAIFFSFFIFILLLGGGFDVIEEIPYVIEEIFEELFYIFDI